MVVEVIGIWRCPSEDPFGGFGQHVDAPVAVPPTVIIVPIASMRRCPSRIEVGHEGNPSEIVGVIALTARHPLADALIQYMPRTHRGGMLDPACRNARLKYLYISFVGK